jgi:KTSC domain-containing protein
MTAVESSNIAAIGFADGLMRVAFKNGNQYEYPGVTAEQHAAVMAAPSTGKAINALVAERAGVVQLKSGVVSPLASGGPIHSNQAEGCCAQHLNNASLSGALDKLEPFSCPKCGTEYRATAHGPLMLWQAQLDVLVFKP